MEVAKRIDIITENNILSLDKKGYAEFLIKRHFPNCIIIIKKMNKLGFSVLKNGKRTIMLNEKAMELFTFAEWKQLVLHEIAHHLVFPVTGHNQVYVNKALELGVVFENTGIKMRGVPFWKVAVAINYKRSKQNVRKKD